MTSLILLLLVVAADVPNADLWKARDSQDRNTLVRLSHESTVAADTHTSDPDLQYRAALAQSTLAEVAMEARDKAQAKTAAETGMKTAERAVALKADRSEYHRILGTLCGQEAAALGGLGALKYGRCALDEVNKALEMDPKSPKNHLSRGVGNYYLPAALGGGIELAIQDFEKSIALDAKFADAHLWLGVALRKANRFADARKEFEKSVQLNPTRIWAKQQLEKTPVQ